MLHIKMIIMNPWCSTGVKNGAFDLRNPPADGSSPRRLKAMPPRFQRSSTAVLYAVAF